VKRSLVGTLFTILLVGNVVWVIYATYRKNVLWCTPLFVEHLWDATWLALKVQPSLCYLIGLLWPLPN